MMKKKIAIGLVTLVMSSISFADEILVRTENGDADQKAISGRLQSIINKNDISGSNLQNLKLSFSQKIFGEAINNLGRSVTGGAIDIRIKSEELSQVGINIVQLEFPCYGETEYRDCPADLGASPSAIAYRLSICINAYVGSVINH
jgi:hypothetical protein